MLRTVSCTEEKLQMVIFIFLLKTHKKINSQKLYQPDLHKFRIFKLLLTRKTKESFNIGKFSFLHTFKV